MAITLTTVSDHLQHGYRIGRVRSGGWIYRKMGKRAFFAAAMPALNRLCAAAH